MTDQTRRTEMMRLDEIKAAKLNPKDHDLGELTVSINRFGFVDAVVMDERTGRLVAGHGRVEALRLMFKEAPGQVPRGIVSQPTGPDGAAVWYVPVQRGWASKDDTEAEAFIIAANRLVELGGWNSEALETMLIDLAKSGEEALAGIGYDSGDVDKLLREIAGDPKADEAPEHQVAQYVREGELWILGDHRLLVGDSTIPENVDRLLDGKIADCVLTDPPYAIYGSSTGIGADIADDKMVRPFFEAIAKVAFARVKLFGHVYMCTDWRSYASLWEGAKRGGLSPKGCLVWDKGNGGMGSMWANCYELIAFFVKTPPAKSMKSGTVSGQRQAFKPNILRYPRVTGDEREHNAAKPVGLMVDVIEVATDKGELVVDFFGGSGSTLMACEKVGRRCCTMELEPKTAQIIVERWQRATGRKAELVEHQASTK